MQIYVKHKVKELNIVSNKVAMMDEVGDNGQGDEAGNSGTNN